MEVNTDPNSLAIRGQAADSKVSGTPGLCGGLSPAPFCDWPSRSCTVKAYQQEGIHTLPLWFPSTFRQREAQQSPETYVQMFKNTRSRGHNRNHSYVLSWGPVTCEFGVETCFCWRSFHWLGYCTLFITRAWCCSFSLTKKWLSRHSEKPVFVQDVISFQF